MSALFQQRYEGYAPRRSKIRPRIRRVLRLGQVVRSDVHPRDEVLLRDVLTIEELVEVDHRRAWQVHVPHAARCRLGVLSLRDRKVISCPISILEQAFGANDGLVGER